jgi:17beta-estradiol 17-dehydrogenase / very-long-chain 3-oxoacyl-CoA reductase
MSLPGLPSLKSIITDNALYQNEYLRLGLFSAGAIFMFLKTLSYTRALLTPLFRFPKDLAARYGKDSWAVVTGASDGIGKGYAIELARRGFNVVLVGRNEAKLKAVAQEVKQNAPQAQFRVVVADFVDAYKEGWAEEIEKQVRDLDVSILVNNAGLGEGRGYFHTVSTGTIRDLVMVNALAHALITRALLPQLLARSSKSAIINTSSIGGSIPAPFNTVYSSTKVFHDFFSRALSYEYPNLDIMSCKPATVLTKMMDVKDAPGGITVEEYVTVTLGQLGHVNQTFGHWKHRVLKSIMHSLPEQTRVGIFKKTFDQADKKTK